MVVVTIGTKFWPKIGTNVSAMPLMQYEVGLPLTVVALHDDPALIVDVEVPIMELV